MGELSDRLIVELCSMPSARSSGRKQSDRLRDIYLIGDIEKDTARSWIERLRELANETTGRSPVHQQRRRECHRRPRHSRCHPPRHQARHRSEDHRAGDGVFDGLDRPAGGKRRQAARLSAFLDHDSRAGEMGRLAVDDGGGAASGAAQTDAGPDLQDPVVPVGQTAASDHQGHQAHRLLPGRTERAGIRANRRGGRGRAPGAEAAAGGRERHALSPSAARGAASARSGARTARRGDRRGKLSLEGRGGQEKRYAIPPCQFRSARHSSSRRAALPATECRVGVHPSARARGLRTT